jgi:hypothetical protein
VAHEWAERWQGLVPVIDGNQGRTDLFVSPGVTWNFRGEWGAILDVHLRAHGHATNAQLDLPAVVELGVGRLFHFEEDLEAGHARAPVIEVSPADVIDAVDRARFLRSERRSR